MNYKNYVIDLLKKHKTLEFHPHAEEQAKARNISISYIKDKLEKRIIIDAFPNPYPRKKQFGNAKTFISGWIINDNQI